MRNIFVVGLDDEHLAQLQTLPEARSYAFHPLFTSRELKQQEQFPVARLLEEGTRILKKFPGQVDAIVGYWDFPVSTTLPLLRHPLGLPGPTLEAVLQCEHKYWSRLRQSEVVPEHVPAFSCLDPFCEDPSAGLNLDFPFWLKPVKSVLSHLGFRINDAAELGLALEKIRKRIGRYAEPFNLILEQANLPPDIASVDGYHCIAEQIISGGMQCTQEGFVFEGEPAIYGTIDSLPCPPAPSSFCRYQYPSALPASVRSRMSRISATVMSHIGYDMAPFNIEYYWDPIRDHIYLLEINTRISKSHAPLFWMVDGCYHHRVMVDLGLGQRPQMPSEGGVCGLAAKFMLRQFKDGLVTHVPDQTEIETIEADLTHTRIHLMVEEGLRLSELRDQDSYSYEVATIFIGADDQHELEGKFLACKERLRLKFRQ